MQPTNLQSEYIKDETFTFAVRIYAPKAFKREGIPRLKHMRRHAWVGENTKTSSEALPEAVRE